MSRRSRAREVALQVLYQDDLNPSQRVVRTDRFVRTRLRDDGALVEFAQQLIAGVRRHRDELDQVLMASAENWSLPRMAVTDRNALRLGAYEILMTDIPDRVAINEAVNLARRFGTDQSALFVNGILDRILNSNTLRP